MYTFDADCTGCRDISLQFGSNVNVARRQARKCLFVLFTTLVVAADNRSIL